MNNENTFRLVYSRYQSSAIHEHSAHKMTILVFILSKLIPKLLSIG